MTLGRDVRDNERSFFELENGKKSGYQRTPTRISAQTFMSPTAWVYPVLTPCFRSSELCCEK
jgi:hypothetical protein